MANRDSIPANAALGLIGNLGNLVNIGGITQSVAGLMSADMLNGVAPRRRGAGGVSDLSKTRENTVEAQSKVAHKMDRKNRKIDIIDELQRKINNLIAENNTYKIKYGNGLFPKSIARIISKNNSDIKQMKLDRDQILKDTDLV